MCFIPSLLSHMIIHQNPVRVRPALKVRDDHQVPCERGDELQGKSVLKTIKRESPPLATTSR